MPYSGIVHHLSGPSTTALGRTFRQRRPASPMRYIHLHFVFCTQVQKPTFFAFTAPVGLGNPVTRTHVRLLGPCFKTGRRRRRPTRDRDASRASERHSLYEPAQVPAGSEARRRGARDSVPNFTLALGPVPAVRRVKGWRNAATGSSHRRAGSSRIPGAAAGPPVSLNLQPRLRERLRLPLHSFTYS